MRFNVWMENQAQLKGIPIQDMILRKEDLELAAHSLSQGRESMTSGPVKVYFVEQENKYDLADGYHRVLRAILDRRDVILAEVHMVDDPNQLYVPPMRDRYVYQPHEHYLGLEDFIAVQTLRRI
jgi:hypothetical protein